MNNGIEHRMYGIEKWIGMSRVYNETKLMTPARATWYQLQGYEIFDYNNSLNMEPVYLEEQCERNLTK